MRLAIGSLALATLLFLFVTGTRREPSSPGEGAWPGAGERPVVADSPPEAGGGLETGASDFAKSNVPGSPKAPAAAASRPFDGSATSGAAKGAAKDFQKPGWPKPLPENADLSQIKLVDILTQPVDVTDPEARAEQDRQLLIVSEARRRAAIAKARQLGLPVEGGTAGGGRFAIEDFLGGKPVYYRTENSGASISTAANQVRGTVQFPGIDGLGIKVGVWDGGHARAGHLAFRMHSSPFSRVEFGDVAPFHDHPTHVAGTIAGLSFPPSNQSAGGPDPILAADVEGMAPRARISSYDFSLDIAELSAAGAAEAGLAGDRICLSNHSYGTAEGWYEGEFGGELIWIWGGDGDGEETGQTDRDFGNYGSLSANLDGLVGARPFLLPFLAAGNDGNQNPEEGDMAALPATPSIRHAYREGLHAPGDGIYKNRYDTLSPTAVSKNAMVVGSIDDAVSGGSRDLGLYVAGLSSFSSCGPTDDGRIKPDIMANGYELASASSIGPSTAERMSGTSMASPNACGSAALLQQLYRSRSNGLAMRASMLKGLIIHTADDLETLGPDYRTGWGLMNARRAADLIASHSSGLGGGELLDDTVTSSGTKTYSYAWDGSQPMRVTICWTDPPGTGTDAPTGNHRTPMLVNDLDLVVTGPTGTVHRPYVMPYVGDWTPGKLSTAATTGTNRTDNVEQVHVSVPIPGLYTVSVTAGALSGGNQTYSLVVSGHAGDPGIVVEQPVGTPLADGSSTVDFGTATTAQSSVRTFRVSNPGGGDLQLSGVTLSGANAADFSIVPPETNLLKPHAAASFAVVMKAASTGVRTAVLRVATNLAGDSSSFDVNLTGTATAVSYTRTYDVLKSFDLDTPAGGYHPRGGLVFQGTTAYGNTYSGGASSRGVVFTVDTVAGYALLGSVGPATGDSPAFPIGPFTDDGGTLIGISGGGGAKGTGTVYVSSGAATTTFTSFPANHSGGSYGSGLVPGEGGYVGTAAFGGSSGFGTLFKIDPVGAYSVLVNFSGAGGAARGSEPCPKLAVASNGAIYGTTRFGGTNGFGTMFRYRAGVFETLIDFGAIPGTTLGINPTTGVIAASDGNIYGTAGTRLFQFNPDSGAVALMGTMPYGFATPLLEGPDGALYGVTGTGPYVQRIHFTPFGGPYTGIAASQYLDFYANPPVFPPPSTPAPSALALGPDGHFYGTSQAGGSFNDGTVFRVRTNFGASPEIDVQQPPGNSLSAGRTSVDFVPFPSVAVGQSVTRTFLVENRSATGSLFIKGISKGGDDPGDFQVSEPSQREIGPGLGTTFTVTFSPSAEGRRSAILFIHNNDSDESVFDLSVSNAAPEIELQDSIYSNLVDGRDVIDMGDVAVGASAAESVTVRNTGTGALKVAGVTKSGIHASDFALANPPSEIAPGASATFNVTFTPGSAGMRVAEMHVESDDADEDPFDIVLMGAGHVAPTPLPTIQVEQPPGTPLTSGLSTVDFGNGGVGVPTPLTFTIRNTHETAALALGGIAVEGPDASDFVAGPPGLTTVPPGGSTTLTVSFTRSSAVSRRAELQIGSNAEDSDPFVVPLAAPSSGPALPEISVTRMSGVGLVDGAGDPVSLGSVPIGETAGIHFAIANRGLAVLTLGNATFDGAHASDFGVTSPETILLPAGAVTRMSVSFRPGGAGARDAILHLASNDPDEDPFDIALTGVGVGGPAIPLDDFAATSISGTGGTLNGIVNPNGKATTVWFEYGPTTGYGRTTARQEIGAGADAVAVAAVIGGLAPLTTYHYRVVAENADGTAYSGDFVFDTTRGAGISILGSTAFGRRTVRTKTVRTLVIRNPGDDPLVVTGITLTSGYSGSFAGTIAPGASRSVKITFTPKAGIAYNGKIVVKSNSASGVSTRRLTGRGVVPRKRGAP